jgi:hypothetical protein
MHNNSIPSQADLPRFFRDRFQALPGGGVYLALLQAGRVHLAAIEMALETAQAIGPADLVATLLGARWTQRLLLEEIASELPTIVEVVADAEQLLALVEPDVCV